MRVLHVMPTVALSYGGPSYAVRRMAKAVVDLGHTVDVIATSFGSPEGDKDATRTWEYEEGGATYRLFPRTGRSSFNLSIALTRFLVAHVAAYDVVHVHVPFTYTTLLACAAARRAGVPFVYRTLGTMAPWSLRQKAWKKLPYYHLVERRNMAWATLVHVTAESEREAIAGLGFGEKTALVPLGVDVGASVDRPRRSGPLRALCLGRLHPKKGIEHLLDAVKSMLAADTEAVRLTIAGAGEPAYEAELSQRITSLGLDAVVEQKGFVEGEEKERVLAAADVFVLPSYDENFGIAVVEAMAAGLPVVVSDAVGVAPEIRAASAGIITRTGSSDDVAAALQELREPETRERMGRDARALVDRSFSVAAMGANLVAMYGRAVTGRG